jgi:hypothetical protein
MSLNEARVEIWGPRGGTSGKECDGSGEGGRATTRKAKHLAEGRTGEPTCPAFRLHQKYSFKANCRLRGVLIWLPEPLSTPKV